MKASKAWILIPLLFLGGCSTAVYCEGEQDYQNDLSVPALQPTDDLRVKESDSALKIPPAPENPVPYGETYKDADGEPAVRCLDRPPDLPASAEPKPVEKPAEKPAA